MLCLKSYRPEPNEARAFFQEADTLKKILFAVLIMVCASSSLFSSDLYKDVPKDHWAAESVQMLSKAGVVNGYPDNTFKGDKTVTRYELAVALQAMIEYIKESEKPLVPKADKAISEPTKTSMTTENKQITPVSAPKINPAKTAAQFLKANGYLSKDSAILKKGHIPVTQKELADSLAAVAVKLMEQRVPGKVN